MHLAGLIIDPHSPLDMTDAVHSSFIDRSLPRDSTLRDVNGEYETP